MFQKRGRDRRVKESGPTKGSLERRNIAERRKIEITESSYDEFEILMSALGFRHPESRASRV